MSLYRSFFFRVVLNFEIILFFDIFKKRKYDIKKIKMLRKISFMEIKRYVLGNMSWL